MRRQQQCRWMVVIGIAVAVVAAITPAQADTPETGIDPTVTLTVTPSDGLSDGQTVTVTGTGFPPNTQGTINECGGTILMPQCDDLINVPFNTTANGDIPPTTVTLKRIVNTGSTTFNCGAQSCAVVARAGGKMSQHHIRMAGAGTSIPNPSSSTSSTTTTSLVPLPQGGAVCGLLRQLFGPFPFLSGLLTNLLSVLGCPAGPAG